MRKLLPRKSAPIIVCAVVGGLLPLISSGLVELMDERVPNILLAPLIILWWLVSLPALIAVIFVPGGGIGIELLMELFWISVGGLGGLLVAQLRPQHRQDATPKA